MPSTRPRKPAATCRTTDGFENSDVRVSAINDACARLPGLRNSLRLGACHRIEKNLLDECNGKIGRNWTMTHC